MIDIAALYRPHQHVLVLNTASGSKTPSICSHCLCDTDFQSANRILFPMKNMKKVISRIGDADMTVMHKSTIYIKLNIFDNVCNVTD